MAHSVYADLAIGRRPVARADARPVHRENAVGDRNGSADFRLPQHADPVGRQGRAVELRASRRREDHFTVGVLRDVGSARRAGKEVHRRRVVQRRTGHREARRQEQRRIGGVIDRRDAEVVGVVRDETRDRQAVIQNERRARHRESLTGRERLIGRVVDARVRLLVRLPRDDRRRAIDRVDLDLRDRRRRIVGDRLRERDVDPVVHGMERRGRERARPVLEDAVAGVPRHRRVQRR